MNDENTNLGAVTEETSDEKNDVKDVVEEISEEKTDVKDVVEETSTSAEPDDVKEKKGCKGCVIALAVLCALLAAVAAVGLYFWQKLNSEKMNTAENEIQVVVNISEGEGVSEIAEQLAHSGVIDNELHFRFLCKKHGKGAEFKYGTYTFTNNMTFSEICDVLEGGALSSTDIMLTVPEGKWASDIAEMAEKKGICTAEEFMEAANSADYDYDFVSQIPSEGRKVLLEGYLYPETYVVKPGTTAKQLVSLMLAEFDKNINNELKTSIQNSGKSLDEIVIIASVIEGEVSYPDERKTVSSVIYNRLDKGMRLQMNDTVQYALGERKRVLESDLKTESDYNTYYVKGLPIGPVGNPGIECLKAAAEPDETDYLYYVLEDAVSKKHKFTSDYNEFLNNKNDYFEKKDG